MGVAKPQMHRMNKVSDAGLQRGDRSLEGCRASSRKGKLLSWGGQESQCQSQTAWF